MRLGLAPAVLPRQGAGGGRRRRVGRLARDRAPDARLRTARHPRQQHRLGPPAHSPLFPIAGDGRYRVQPVSVEDVASICVDAGEQGCRRRGRRRRPGDADVRRARAPRSGCRGLAVPHRALAARSSCWALARAAGAARRDVLLTSEELAGLEASLLVSDRPPLGTASFRSWVAANGERLGRGVRLRAGTQLPSVRSALMARSELTVDLGAIRRNVRTLLRALEGVGAVGRRQGGRLRARRRRRGRRGAGSGCDRALRGDRPGGARAAAGARRRTRSSSWGLATSREIADARDAALELVIADGEVPEGVRAHLKLDTGMGRWGLCGAARAGPRGRRADEPLRLRRLRRGLHRAADRALSRRHRRATRT